MQRVNYTYNHKVILISILLSLLTFLIIGIGNSIRYNYVSTNGIEYTGYISDNEISFEYEGKKHIAYISYDVEDGFVTFYFIPTESYETTAVVPEEMELTYMMLLFSLICLISTVITLLLKIKKDRYVSSIKASSMHAKAHITNVVNSDSYIIMNAVYDDPFENRILYFKTPKISNSKLLKLYKQNPELKGYLYVSYLKEDPKIYIVDAYELK